MKEIKRGFVLGDSGNDPPRYAVSFRAQVIILDHPGEIKAGYTPSIKCHSASISCRIVKTESKIDRMTGKILEDSPNRIKQGDSAIVLMRP